MSGNPFEIGNNKEKITVNSEVGISDEHDETTQSQIEEENQVNTETEQQNTSSSENEGTQKRSKNRRRTKDDVKKILYEYTQKETNQFVNELGLTHQQVYRTIKEAREHFNHLIETTDDEDQKEKIRYLMETYIPQKSFGNTKEKTEHDVINNVINDMIEEV